jgi:hypothetical protein
MKIAAANPLWGAPRIHGELGKFGIEVSERTVSRLVRRPRCPPSQTWRTFLTNHVPALGSMDFFTVPTVTGRILFVFVVLLHHRRRIVLGEVLSAPSSPWQNPYADRLIGSIRCDCLNHMVVLGEQHLRRVLAGYLAYYHGSGTHLSLAKDAPTPRRVQSVTEGDVIAFREVGGLHHRYQRRAASHDFVGCAGHVKVRLTSDQARVLSERSGVPILAIIRAINPRDVAIATGYSPALVLAKDSIADVVSAPASPWHRVRVAALRATASAARRDGASAVSIQHGAMPRAASRLHGRL